MHSFKQLSDAIESIDGWFTPLSTAIFDSLLTMQRAGDVSGHLAEIGVWEGKSAAMLCAHARSSDEVILLDPLLEDRAARVRANLADVVGAFDFELRLLSIYSDHFERLQGRAPYARSVRFLHVDGAHTAEAVEADLDLAAWLVSTDGLVVLDDFLSPRYPQVTEAAYRWLFLHPGRFRLFLVDGHKGCLCRTGALLRYQSIALEALPGALSERGLTTTVHKSSGFGDSFTVGVALQDLWKDARRGPDWAPKQIETPVQRTSDDEWPER